MHRNAGALSRWRWFYGVLKFYRNSWKWFLTNCCQWQSLSDKNKTTHILCIAMQDHCQDEAGFIESQILNNKSTESCNNKPQIFHNKTLLMWGSMF